MAEIHFIELAKLREKTNIDTSNLLNEWLLFIENPEGEKIVNDSLIESLIKLLREFEEIGYDLSFTDKYIVHGNCCKDNQYTLNNEKNHTIQNHHPIKNNKQKM